MPSSSNILKGLENSIDCRVLEVRHRFAVVKADAGSAAGGNGQPGLDPELLAGRIIAGAREEAGRILDEAGAAAREILERAGRDAEEEAGRLKMQARDQGFEEGKREALAVAAAEASSIREEARAVIRQSEEIRRQTIESLESEIIGLAVDIAEKVLSAELELHPRAVVKIAREAITMLQDREQVVLYVNPAEAALYEESREDLARHLSPGGKLHIVSDSAMDPGGCVAETAHGRVDARLGARWGLLLKALEGAGR